jgi:hypothetical protein
MQFIFAPRNLHTPRRALHETTAITANPLLSRSILTFLESSSVRPSGLPLRAAPQTLPLPRLEGVDQLRAGPAVRVHVNPPAGRAKALARTLLMERIVDEKVPSGLHMPIAYGDQGPRASARCRISREYRTTFRISKLMYSDHHSLS